MKTSELRLNNWVSFLNMPKKIASIDPIGIMLLNEVKSPEMSPYSCVILVESVEPIPLTEEILLKAGFKAPKYSFSKEWEHSKGNFDCSPFCIEYFKEGLYFNGAEGVSLGIPLIHVHQLQNLYFILTGEELEIKL